MGEGVQQRGGGMARVQRRVSVSGRVASKTKKPAKRENAATRSKLATKKVAAKKEVKVAKPRSREDQISNLILTHRENGRKLARSILRKWRVRMPAEEIDSIVDLGLCEAARRFSDDRGASFMTFFFYHLRGHLVRAVARATHTSSTFINISRENGKDGVEWVAAGAEGAWALIPDSMPLGHRESDTPEHLVLRRERIERCQTACSKLDVLEREILDRSFATEQPLVDIAKSLGYSRCHISRVKKSALDRMKLMLESEEGKLLAPAAPVVAEAPVSPVKLEVIKTAVDASANDRLSTMRRGRRRTFAKPRDRVAGAAYPTSQAA